MAPGQGRRAAPPGSPCAPPQPRGRAPAGLRSAFCSPWLSLGCQGTASQPLLPVPRASCLFHAKQPLTGTDGAEVLPPLPVMQRGEMSTRANCVLSSGGRLTALHGSRCAPEPVSPCSVLAVRGCHWVSCAEGATGTRSDVPSCPGNLLGRRRHLLTAPDSVSGTPAGKASISAPASCLQNSGGVKEGLGPGRAPQRAPTPGHGEQ